MKLKLTLTLIEEMLGTNPANRNVFGDFIASKAPDDDARKEELETAEHREEAGTTIFASMPYGEYAALLKRHRQDDLILPEEAVFRKTDGAVVGLWNYAVKGFFKDAANATNRFDKHMRNELAQRGGATIPKDGMEKLSAYKTRIDGTLFVNPRFIPLLLEPGQGIGVCERSLRADTPMGPRVTVVRSESAPAGTRLSVVVDLLSKELEPYVRLWLAYGQQRGLGCWRNSGKGAFEFCVESET